MCDIGQSAAMHLNAVGCSSRADALIEFFLAAYTAAVIHSVFQLVRQ